MKLSLSASHLQRYKQIGMLLWKYGRSDLVTQMGLEDSMDGDRPLAQNSDIPPEQLAEDLEALGPTYVKVGQVLSSRADLLPPAYLKALSRLQDQVKPFAYDEVEKIVSAELGVRISKAFSSFDTEPMAAASLGQVHSAALRDGRPVVVKVQRPGIAAQVTEDFEVLSEIADFLDQHTELGRRYRFTVLLEEMRVTLQQELNYEREAQNLVTLGRNLEEFPLIEVPQPVPDYSTRRVLTMDRVRGRKITSIGPLANLEMRGAELAEELFRAYLKQVLVDGTFHADPHPGNVFVTSDGRIALLDLGMIGHTTQAMQQNLLKILIGVSESKPDEVAAVVVDMSQTTDDFDRPEFERRVRQVVALHQDQPLAQMNVGRNLLRVSRIASETGLYVPAELTLLGKTLLQLDEVGRILDPEFDTSASIRRNVAEIMSRRMGKDASQGSVFASLLEMKDFVTGLPARLNKILDAVSNAELEVKVRVLDARLVMEGLQKIANRVATGLILAALIVGASLLMRVETDFRLFGYPGLAMVLFLAAVAGGVWLVLSISIQDRQSEKKAARLTQQ